MDTFLLKARTRIASRQQLRALRKQGRIPAVVYGHGVETRSLDVPALSFSKIFQEAGESTLIDLTVDDQPAVKTLVQEVQREPATGAILHVDFHQVKMTETVELDVALLFTGEAPAVKELGGTLVKARDALKVRCLPTDLVKEIAVDIGSLKDFDDILRVKDLVVPGGLDVLDPLEDSVVYVEAPRSEKEIEELSSAVTEDVSQVEKIEKPKEEEDAEAVVAAPEAAKEP